jgi:hypothetical protein
MGTTHLTFILQSSLKNEFMGRDGWEEANARISQDPPLVSSSSENVVPYKLCLSLNVTIKKLVSFSFCFLYQILLHPTPSKLILPFPTNSAQSVENFY